MRERLLQAGCLSPKRGVRPLWQCYVCFACRSVLAQIGRQVSVFTLGYGSEHDGDCLNGLAAAGNGLFYFVENEDSIPESFCDCLGGLLSVAAQVG